MSRKFYKNLSRTEPDMRFEFNSTIDGRFPEIAKGQIHVLRKMRRSPTDVIAADENLRLLFHGRKQLEDYFVPGEGYLIPCDCVDKITKEADLDYYCPIRIVTGKQ